MSSPSRVSYDLVFLRLIDDDKIMMMMMVTPSPTMTLRYDKNNICKGLDLHKEELNDSTNTEWECCSPTVFYLDFENWLKFQTNCNCINN
uniref:Uncharacterized protein n=1 Tax=Helianthus annuus TaxID=4232 RepID=A0A251TV73_HELAN